MRAAIVLALGYVVGALALAVVAFGAWQTGDAFPATSFGEAALGLTQAPLARLSVLLAALSLTLTANAERS